MKIFHFNGGNNYGNTNWVVVAESEADAVRKIEADIDRRYELNLINPYCIQGLEDDVRKRYKDALKKHIDRSGFYGIDEHDLDWVYPHDFA